MSLRLSFIAALALLALVAFGQNQTERNLSVFAPAANPSYDQRIKQLEQRIQFLENQVRTIQRDSAMAARFRPTTQDSRVPTTNKRFSFSSPSAK